MTKLERHPKSQGKLRSFPKVTLNPFCNTKIFIDMRKIEVNMAKYETKPKRQNVAFARRVFRIKEQIDIQLTNKRGLVSWTLSATDSMAC